MKNEVKEEIKENHHEGILENEENKNLLKNEGISSNGNYLKFIF